MANFQGFVQMPLGVKPAENKPVNFGQAGLFGNKPTGRDVFWWCIQPAKQQEATEQRPGNLSCKTGHIQQFPQQGFS